MSSRSTARQEVSALGDNRFLYWPDALGIGKHTISVDAVDAAGNEDTVRVQLHGR